MSATIHIMDDDSSVSDETIEMRTAAVGRQEALMAPIISEPEATTLT